MDNTLTGTRARNDELYPLVVKGDRAAMDEMILLNIAMVKHTVKKFLGRHPHFNYLSADLVSHGTIGLVQAVNRMAGIKTDGEIEPPEETLNPNPSSLIGTFIFYCLGELIDSENALRVPKRSYSRKSKQGFQVPIKEAAIDSSYVFQQDGLTDPRTAVDFLDELLGCCSTEAERQILQSRIDGRSDVETAEIMGLPRSTVQLMRQHIYERFKERNDEYAND